MITTGVTPKVGIFKDRRSSGGTSSAQVNAHLNPRPIHPSTRTHNSTIYYKTVPRYILCERFIIYANQVRLSATGVHRTPATEAIVSYHVYIIL